MHAYDKTDGSTVSEIEQNSDILNATLKINIKADNLAGVSWSYVNMHIWAKNGTSNFSHFGSIAKTDCLTIKFMIKDIDKFGV